MTSFISRRKSNARKPRRPSVPSADGPPSKLAEHTTTCPACDKLMVQDRDMIVFDFTLRTWVHDNGQCRTNDTLNT